MKIDQGKFTPIEALTNDEGKIQFTPPTTARKLVGARKHDELSLAQAPLSITRKVVDGDTTEYSAVINRPLEGHSFHTFLSAVAPDPAFGRSIVGVLGDWEDQNEERMQKHGNGLGEHWREFQIHKRHFIQSFRMEDRVKASFVTVNYQLHSYGELERHFLEEMDEQLVDGTYNYNPNVVPAEFKHLLAEYLRSISFARGNSTDEQAVFDLRLHPRGFRFYDPFIASVDNGQLREIIPTWGYAHGASIICFPDDPEGVPYIDHENFTVVASGNEGIRITLRPTFQAEARAVTNNDNRTAWQLLPDTVQSTNVLIPTVRWRNQTGSRSLIFDSLSDQEAQQYRSELGLGEVPDGLTFDPERFDTLVGLMAVPYLLPGVRRGWPKKVGLPESDRKQTMGQAQVPVLASIMRNDILRSSFFELAERYAAKHLKSAV